MRALLALLCVAPALACAAPSDEDRLAVSVAASVSDVIGDLAARYRVSSRTVIDVNVGPSNSLARQIVNGAPVDLFVSADETQMEVVERAGRVVSGSRVHLLSNQLAVITPRDARVAVHGAQDLARADVRRVALAHPETVPAGVYARQWLERQGMWRSVQPKVIPLPTVRAALAAVREGRADAGVVYVTDARTSSDVVVTHLVPLDAAPTITYPAAVIKGQRQEGAIRFLHYLQSDEARDVFVAAGFVVVTR